MRDFTFLPEEQLYGSNKLEVLKKRGSYATLTDFSIYLGAQVSETYNNEKFGIYWTKSDNGIGYVTTIEGNGACTHSIVNERDISIRPALSFSSIDSIPQNDKKGKKVEDGVFEVEYGYYPQNAVSKKLQQRLEKAYNSGGDSISKTGNSYTTDAGQDYDDEFIAKQHDEYAYNGKRYIRVRVNSLLGKKFTLSNNEHYKDGDIIWIEVSPVKWLVDEKAKIMITDKLILSGVQFDQTSEYQTEDFNKTEIKEFMDKYLSRELEQTIDKKTLQKVSPRKSRLQRLNPDNTDISDRRKMTDTEIIHDWIESGESVLLRGPSGIGKTERIKTLYPNVIYLKLTNNMFPEKVVGSTNLQTGESIPPDYAKTAIMQAATEEEKELVKKNIQNIYDVADKIYERSKNSDKKIVILLDELLNVNQNVQGLVYTLVLNRIVEIGKGLKLPDNVVLVGTGNQKKYSSVAQDLAEPLAKRFDHILDMEPKVGEWIKEYAIPNKIHPAVTGYILSKYSYSGKSEDIEDIGYFYEEPEVGEEHLDANGCPGKTNDPRGWESISNTLYNFERNLQQGKYEGKNVEDIMQRSLNSKLREEWAADFFDFYNLPTLTPEEVTKGMGKGYTQADLPRDISERFAYMTALLTADETQVEKCRDFIRKYCDPEYLTVYDIYWAGNDDKKMEKISEWQELALTSHIEKEENER